MCWNHQQRVRYCWLIWTLAVGYIAIETPKETQLLMMWAWACLHLKTGLFPSQNGSFIGSKLWTFPNHHFFFKWWFSHNKIVIFQPFSHWISSWCCFLVRGGPVRAAQEAFRAVVAAFEVLIDPGRRIGFDVDMKKQQETWNQGFYKGNHPQMAWLIREIIPKWEIYGKICRLLIYLVN